MSLILNDIYRIVAASFIVGSCIFFILVKDNYSSVHYLNGKKDEANIKEISLADLLILLQQEDSICIDARPIKYYKYGHIPNARSLFDESIFKENIGRIIFYDYKSQKNLKEKIRQYCGKFKDIDILVYSGGWEEWKACNLQVER